jgi:outer membrane autotransporter protein
MIKQLICVGFLFSVAGLTSYAQTTRDTTQRRNTIKLDITSHWLFQNAFMFSYERVTKNKPYQTWGITAGVQQFPSLGGDLGGVKVKREYDASGIKLGGEYRFYLMKENKYKAPRGVYLGPYTTFHNYSNARSIEVDNDGTLESANLKTDLNVTNIGVQLGYQFVLNNRWTIDMVFVGPSISNYRFKANVDGNFTFDPDDITNEVLLALMDKYPGFSELINEGELVSKGKINTWAYGYRYQLQIGYHFGRKKK